MRVSQTATLRVLRRARALVTKGWTWRAFARDAKGAIVSPLDPRAACFCLRGAIERAAHDEARSRKRKPADVFALYLSAGSRVADAIGSHPIMFNDRPEATQAKVVRAFDCAIAGRAYDDECEAAQ